MSFSPTGPLRSPSDSSNFTKAVKSSDDFASASTSTHLIKLFSVPLCLCGEFDPCRSVKIRGEELLPFEILLSSPKMPPSLPSYPQSRNDRKQHRLQIQAFAQSHLHAFVHGLHRVLHRQRCIGNNLRRNRLCPRNQPAATVTHSPARCDAPPRRNHLARQHHLHRNASAHQPRQPLRSTISRNNSQLHLGLTSFAFSLASRIVHASAISIRRRAQIH